LRIRSTVAAILIYLAVALGACTGVSTVSPAIGEPVKITAPPGSAPPTPCTCALVPETPIPATPFTSTAFSIQVFFTDSARHAAGAPPFEVGVTRAADPEMPLPEQVLALFFRGPTEEERQRGLVPIRSGFTGFRELRVEDGIAHVYLIGECDSQGATYSIAQTILANLLQFPEIQYVKIYDAQGSTEAPAGESNSIPFCLEP